MRTAYLFTLLALLGLAAAVALPAAPYLLGPEDVLAVNVLRHPELSLEVTILADGAINYPVMGKVTLAGLTVEQAAEAIAEGLKSELREPQVAVVVKTPRPRRVYVNGAVGRPGICDWQEGWRLSEAIAAAGGLTILPEAAHTTIFRAGCDPISADLYALYVKTDPAANLPVQPGDSITINQNTVRIYITGQVAKPGMYDLPVGAGVRQAIALAGGLQERAAGSRAYLVRGGQKIPVNLTLALEQGSTEGEAALQAEDVLHVPENLDSLAVFGHVNKPGYYEIKDGDVMTVAKAVSMAGGTDDRADSKKVLVVRTGADGQSQLLKVNLHAIMVEGHGELNLALQPSDIVFVCGKTRFKDTNILSGLYGLNVVRTLLLGF